MLGELEGGGSRALLYSSGQAATFACLYHFAPRRVALRGGYHGTRQAVDLLRQRGVVSEVVDLDSTELEAGDVVWVETPNNPLCEVVDVRAAALRAHASGAKLVVDATFAPPPLQFCLDLGADVVMHSTTKFLAGHSDCLGGALVTRCAETFAALGNERLVMGNVPGSLDVWLLLRSLRTLRLRVTRQSESAAVLAAWLASDAGRALGCVRVYHPSLADCVGSSVAAAQMVGGRGGVLSFLLDEAGVARGVPARTRLMHDATSLGGVETLVEYRHKWDKAVSNCLLRISVGLEDPGDLQLDLAQAIQAVRRASLGDERGSTARAT